LLNGGDVNADVYISKYGREPIQFPLLLWAVENGDLEVVKMLIEAGADVNIQDINGVTPKDLADKQALIR
jgi:hypothetical protein